MSSTPRPVSPLSTAEGAAADGALASARPGRSVLENHPPMPTPSSIEPLLVAQLRAELEARALDSSGCKAELQKRLLEAQPQEWQASLEQRDAALKTMVEQADRRAKAAERKAEKADHKAEKVKQNNAILTRCMCVFVAETKEKQAERDFELKKQALKIAYLEREAGIDLSGIDRLIEEERNGGANLNGGDGSETGGDGSGAVDEGNENES